MVNECLKVTGKVTIKKNGEVEREINNLVVTAGKELIATLISGSGTAIGYMAVGTGSTAAAVGNTALETEIDRNALTVAGGTASSNTVEYEAVWNSGDGTGSLTEAGLFNASSAGTMLARTVFSAVNKAASDVLTITWTITIS